MKFLRDLPAALLFLGYMAALFGVPAIIMEMVKR